MRPEIVHVQSSTVVKRPALAGAELACFLLFPSLGIVQKYLGTSMAYAYFGVGSLALMAAGVRSLTAAYEVKAIRQPWARAALGAMFCGLAVAFFLIYTRAGNGNDRGESLNLGIQQLLTGRYPYYRTTHFQNVVTQMPGSLLLAVPFALLGDAVWQNLFWLAALLLVGRALFGERLTLALMALIFFLSPAVLQDFATGGDLGASAIAILIGTLSMVTLVPDQSVAGWKKVIAAVFTGMALSSRMNCLLLAPVLFAAMWRRSGISDALFYLCVAGFAFAAVTVPFYWHDPSGFAPLHLHNKFSMFGEVPNGGFLFPALSLAFSLLVSSHPGNRTLRGWLIQSAWVMAFPVVCLVALATYRSGGPNFAFTDYALASVFFGGVGIALGVQPAARFDLRAWRT